MGFSLWTTPYGSLVQREVKIRLFIDISKNVADVFRRKFFVTDNVL